MKTKLLLLIFSLLGSTSFAQTQLTVRAFSQGYYKPATNSMRAVADPFNNPAHCDTVVIGLRNPISMNIDFCEYASIDTNGYVTCYINPFISGDYYVTLLFRNTIHIHSAATVYIGNMTASVDLTLQQNVAFCDNDSSNGVAKALSGDVASMVGIGYHDFFVEASDYSAVENSVLLHDTGYVITDLTGDRVVDSADYLLVEANVDIVAHDTYVDNCFLTTTSVREIVVEEIYFYPNPVTDYLTVDLKNFPDARLSLYDSMGRRVFSESASIESMQLDCSSFPGGLYLLTIESESKIVKGRLVVQH